MGSGPFRNTFKADVKTNALKVAAWTRDMSAAQDDIMATATAAVALAGVQQAERNGVVRGSRTPEGKSPYYMLPPPGGDIPTATPKAYDFANRRGNLIFGRDAAGHILARSFAGGVGTRYYIHDKIVNRTGHALSGLTFDENPEDVPLAPMHHMESSMGTLSISTIGNTTLVAASNDADGQKLTTLEKKGAQNGALQPRYFLRRGLQGAARRWSTAAAKALGLAKKRAKQRTGS